MDHINDAHAVGQPIYLLCIVGVREIVLEDLLFQSEVGNQSLNQVNQTESDEAAGQGESQVKKLLDFLLLFGCVDIFNCVWPTLLFSHNNG